jgi:hypothetical protein
VYALSEGRVVQLDVYESPAKALEAFGLSG